MLGVERIDQRKTEENCVTDRDEPCSLSPETGRNAIVMDRYSKVWMFVLIALVFTVQTETLEKQKLQAREMATLVEDGKAALLDRRFREAIALFSKPFEHDQSSQDISTLLALAHLGDDNYEESRKPASLLVTPQYMAIGA